MPQEFIVNAREIKALLERTEPGNLTTYAGTDGRPRVTARWLTEEGMQVGDDLPLEVPEPTTVEAFAPSGRIERVAVEPSLSFEAAPAPEAAVLELRSGTYSVELNRASVEVEKWQDPPAKLFPPGGGAFEFPVFAERFDDEAKFLSLVRDLYEWISRFPPFNKSPIKDRFALRAYYWATDPVRGRFGTPDTGHNYDCKRDRERTWAWPVDHINPQARAALKHLMFKGRYGFVLIDSDLRGGAGGNSDHGYPAWSSRSGCDGEEWYAVALHEIGHSFDLDDEYEGGLNTTCLMGGTQNRMFCASCGDKITATILQH